MLKTIELHRYRGFQSYRLNDLTHVNLLVGKNNCGKTSILEAVDLLVSRGSIAALQDSALRRGELNEDVNYYGVDISHVFHGHQCVPGASFELSSPGSTHRLTAKILPLDEIGEAAELALMTKRRRIGSEEEPVAAFGLRLDSNDQQPVVLPIAENGSFLDHFSPRSARYERSQRAVRFLDFEPSSMRTTWNAVVAERRETEIVEAMSILMPDIDSVHFLAGTRHQGILVGQRNAGLRLPIGSYGDGMRRLLAVSLALVATENGCLLIDELDTGLHWTVMKDMWRLIVETAQRYKVQVFATTHSYDCIRGLGTLVRSRPDLGELVAVQKVHRSLGQAVCICGDEIPIAVEQDIEVR